MINTKKYIIKRKNLDKSEERQELSEFLEKEFSKPLEELNFNCFPFHSKEKKEKNGGAYTLKFLNPSSEKIESLLTQMKYRLQEGNGEAVYEIGVGEDGNPLGLNKDDMHSSLSKSNF